jgi:hypothetical protein
VFFNDYTISRVKAQDQLGTFFQEVFWKMLRMSSPVQVKDQIYFATLLYNSSTAFITLCIAHDNDDIGTAGLKPTFSYK